MERSNFLVIKGEIRLDNLRFPFGRKSVEQYIVPRWAETSEKPVI